MTLLRATLRWTLLTGALNLAWEILQLPLYMVYAEGDRWRIAYAVAHCTAGDVLIAAATYLIAAGATRSPQWIVARPLAGGAIAVIAGMSYAAFSEWLNVSVRGSWAYAPAMPQLFGIGLSPLLQWLAVPVATLYMLRVSGRGRRGV